jgi:DNA-binding SARP family transcriptional activator
VASDVAVTVLGSVEARRSSVDIPIVGRKMQALLALIALSAQRPVSDGRLIDEVWCGDVLANPTNSLQAAVAQLRRLLGRPVVERRGGGYLLAVEPDDVDALRFERLVLRARRLAAAEDHRNAAQAFRVALSLIRGPPLGDLIDHAFAREASARLEELRLSAHEGLAEADLASGRHAEQVTALFDLVAQHPLRERFHAQLITALYRCGRQSDALHAYGRARRTLIEELGLEPGRELRDLELAVLSQDPVLDPPRPRATPVTPRPTDGGARRSRVTGSFVGREAEMTSLTTDLDDAIAGHGRIALFGGEPGIGKSRLAAEVGRVAQERGAVVAFGRCHDGAGSPTLWPWAQVLQSVLATTGPPATVRARDAAQIARLIPDEDHAGRGLATAAVPGPVDADEDRFRLFDAIGRVVSALASVQPIMIVLDDLQWADTATLQLLSFLTREILDTSLLIVGTYRNVGAPTLGLLAETIADLAGQPSVTLTDLVGLDRAATATLIQASGHAADDHFVDTLHQRAQGNPFFVIETLRLYVSSGAMGAPMAIPSGVREVIRQRVRLLPDQTIAALEAAAVLGAEFERRVLAQMLDIDATPALELLEPAFTARLVVSDDGLGKRSRFAHGLVRDTIYEGLGIAARATLHQRAATALETVHGADDGPHLARLAEHWTLASPASTADKAVVCAVRSARWAQRHLVHDQTADALWSAVGLLESMEPGRHRDELELQLHNELSTVLIVTKGYSAPGLDRACDRMRELCERTSDPDLLVPALWRLGMVHVVDDELNTATAIGERLLGSPEEPGGDERRRLAGHMMLGPLYTYRGELLRARHHLDAAADLCGTDIADRIAPFVPEDPWVWVAAMSAWNWSLLGDDKRADDDVVAALHLASSAIDTPRPNRTSPRALATWMAAVVATMRRDVTAMRERSQRALTAVTDGGHSTTFVAHLVATLAWVDAVDDDSQRPSVSIDGLAAALTASGTASWRHATRAFLADALLVNGLPDDALDAADDGLDGIPPGGSRWFAAELHRLRGVALATTGRYEPAGQAFHTAIGTAMAQGAHGLEQRARATQAEWARRR